MKSFYSAFCILTALTVMLAAGCAAVLYNSYPSLAWIPLVLFLAVLIGALLFISGSSVFAPVGSIVW